MKPGDAHCGHKRHRKLTVTGYEDYPDKTFFLRVCVLLEDVENVSEPPGLWAICRTSCQLQKRRGPVCISDDALEARGLRCQSRSPVKVRSDPSECCRS